MNYPALLVLIIELAAGVVYLTQGKGLLAGLWASYAISTVFLLLLDRKLSQL